MTERSGKVIFSPGKFPSVVVSFTAVKCVIGSESEAERWYIAEASWM
ncbi:MAG TPA: hypothetical protein VEC99_07730 [Clostridia bacterium]|nr:hypothetical protein [Clostridia bacterium]